MPHTLSAKSSGKSSGYSRPFTRPAYRTLQLAFVQSLLLLDTPLLLVFPVNHSGIILCASVWSIRSIQFDNVWK
jgi:hypothetical protein